MKNLAGNKECDEYIRDELMRAQIDVIEVEPSIGEVPYSLEGRLGAIKFSRAWYYWVAIGKVPLSIAEKLYDHPEGKNTVRVTGNCTCPPPEKCIEWFNEDGKQLMLKSKYEEEKESAKDSTFLNEILDRMPEKYDIVNVYEENGKPFITSYHIDSQAGLLLFGMKLKEYCQNTNSCCTDERRSMNGGCVSCGDPCL